MINKDDSFSSLTLANITTIKAVIVQLAIRVKAKRFKYIVKRVKGDVEELDINDKKEHKEV